MDIVLDYVDEAYIEKMVGYEVDCGDGKGSIKACHNVGDFITIILEEYERAESVYKKNCDEGGYAPSCFNLARMYGEEISKNIAYFYDIVCIQQLERRP